MKKNIFEYTSYKSYLNDLIDVQPKQGRGFKTALAQSTSCQLTLVSQVLGSSRHFTLEQGEAINDFLAHGEDESRFFLILLGFERAGTTALRRRYQKDLDREVQKYLTLRNRFKTQDILSTEAQATFYSSWIYLAIHVALTIPGLRTKEALAKKFHLAVSTVSHVIDFLTMTGLAEQRGTEYLPGTKTTFIGNDAPMIAQHHLNWRMQAIANFDPASKEDLHYSAFVSLPQGEFMKLKSIFVKAIEMARKGWSQTTNEEELAAITLDFFRFR